MDTIIQALYGILLVASSLYMLACLCVIVAVVIGVGRHKSG